MEGWEEVAARIRFGINEETRFLAHLHRTACVAVQVSLGMTSEANALLRNDNQRDLAHTLLILLNFCARLLSVL